MTPHPSGADNVLSLTDVTRGKAIQARPRRLVIGGYTGRDETAVRKHIDELAAIGIEPPPSVPTFYELDPSLLTTSERIVVGTDTTSGEVEPVLIRISNEFYLGVGSDHTDRYVEQRSVAESKRACPKPLSSQVVALPADSGDGVWDAARVRSGVDGVTYQDGPLRELREPVDLLAQLREMTGDNGEDLVVFAGTLPLLGGTFRYGREWFVELALPNGQTLKHAYTVEQRSGQ